WALRLKSFAAYGGRQRNLTAIRRSILRGPANGKVRYYLEVPVDVSLLDFQYAARDAVYWKINMIQSIHFVGLLKLTL
ncbi:MAG: hypothetical protein ACWA49_07830, partial [Ruegeria sp.]